MSEVGHNSSDINSDQLRSIVERVERVNEEICALNTDKKEIFAEAKGNGFDPKIIRKIISMRAQDADKRAEEEAMIELYLASLGQLADTPLGQSAISRARY